MDLADVLWSRSPRRRWSLGRGSSRTAAPRGLALRRVGPDRLDQPLDHPAVVGRRNRSFRSAGLEDLHVLADVALDDRAEAAGRARGRERRSAPGRGSRASGPGQVEGQLLQTPLAAELGQGHVVDPARARQREPARLLTLRRLDLDLGRDAGRVEDERWGRSPSPPPPGCGSPACSPRPAGT